MQDAHPTGTAAVSWANGRIDTFWVDAGRSLIHRAFADGAVARCRVARWGARIAAGRHRLGRRPAPGLRDPRRRRALEPLLGRHELAPVGVARRRPDRDSRGVVVGPGSDRRLRTRPGRHASGIAGGTGRAGSSGSGYPRSDKHEISQAPYGSSRRPARSEVPPTRQDVIPLSERPARADHPAPEADMDPSAAPWRVLESSVVAGRRRRSRGRCDRRHRPERSSSRRSPPRP